MKKNANWKLFWKKLLDLLEIHLPSIIFILLFLSFLIGIFARYILKNPQSWTFEFSSICYLAVGILSWGIAHRTDEHVVFDMLYEKLSSKAQCILRIISNIVMAVTAALLIYPSITYMQGMAGLTAQIIKIPRYIIFLPFTISFTVAFVRSAYRAITDIRSFVKKNYVQQYGKGGNAE